MAMICANCGSHETQAQLDSFQCLMCGRRTLSDGTLVEAGKMGPGGGDELTVR